MLTRRRRARLFPRYHSDGSYPQNTGLSEIGGTLSGSLPSLPDLLKSQGYKTAAFVGSIHLDPWNGVAQGLDRGFQSYDAGFRPVTAGDAKAPVTERSGAEVVAHAAAWLAKNAQGPFFIWVHIMMRAQRTLAITLSSARPTRRSASY